MEAEAEYARARLPANLAGSDRLVQIERRIPFGHFGALISFACVAVGSDSGPKHFAALRGTEMVTLFTARIDGRNGPRRMSARSSAGGCRARAASPFMTSRNADGNFTCIGDIAPREVADAVLRYAGTSSKRPGERPIATPAP